MDICSMFFVTRSPKFRSTLNCSANDSLILFSIIWYFLVYFRLQLTGNKWHVEIKIKTFLYYFLFLRLEMMLTCMVLKFYDIEIFWFYYFSLFCNSYIIIECRINKIIMLPENSKNGILFVFERFLVNLGC